MQQRTARQVRELQEITIKTDTRDILSHATIQAEGMEDYFLVDIDAHVTETQFWSEIIDLIDNDVIRQMGQAMAARPGTANTALLNSQPGVAFQNVYGRIPHQMTLAEASTAASATISPSWRAAPWMPWASTTRWCSRRRCWCSACTRRRTSRLPSAAPTIAG
jgi:hypothetical protein